MEIDLRGHLMTREQLDAELLKLRDRTDLDRAIEASESFSEALRVATDWLIERVSAADTLMFSYAFGELPDRPDTLSIAPAAESGSTD